MGGKKNDGNFDTSDGIVPVVIGIVIGYLGFIVMQGYSQWFALPLFIYDILLVVVSIYVIRKRYRDITKRIIRDVTENVSRITAGMDMEEEKAGGFFSSDTAKLYAAIEALNESLLSQSNSKDNVIAIINSIALNIELDKLLDDMLPKIIEGTRSNWGAFYLNNSQTEKMELKSSVGFSKSVYQEFDIAVGDGFIGRSAQTDEIAVFNNIPDDTIYISKTFLGKIKPRSIMTVPINSDGKNVAILLLASIYDYSGEQLEIARLIRYYIGSAVMNGLTFERTKRLKNELLFQNQLIQSMNEELEQKVEQRAKFLNDVLDSIVDYSIISVDADGHILTWNKGAEMMWSRPAEEASGKHISDMFAEESADDFYKKLETAQKHGRYEDFHWMSKSDGKLLYTHRMLMAVHDERGYVKAYAAIIKNMTDNKLLEDKAEYLNSLCSVLLSKDESGIITMDKSGVIINAGKKAAELFGLSAVDMEGTRFESFLSDSGVFKKHLEDCVCGCDSKKRAVKFRAKASDLEISVSLALMGAAGEGEKYAAAFITIANAISERDLERVPNTAQRPSFG